MSAAFSCSSKQVLLLAIYLLCGLFTFFLGIVLSHIHSSGQSRCSAVYTAPTVQSQSAAAKTTNTFSSHLHFNQSIMFSYQLSLVMKSRSTPSLHGATISESMPLEEMQPSVLSKVFHMYHHPSHPLSNELLLQLQPEDPQTASTEGHDYDACRRIFLTRTGSLANMPNKCMAIAPVVGGFHDPIPHYIRTGKISGLVNMFQGDYLDQHALRTEKLLLPLFLEHANELIGDLQELVTGRREYPTDANNSIVVMVLNEGVVDLFLNFVCSVKSAGIDHLLQKVVVFVGHEDLVSVVTKMGVKAYYSPYLGPIPAKAADFYGDLTFAMLMWFKTTSVFLTVKAGFNVLFQVRLNL